MKGELLTVAAIFHYVPVENVSIVNKGSRTIKAPFSLYVSVNTFLFDCLCCAAVH